MADLAKIQFLRSTVAGKTPTTSQLADGELAINMADYAIYTKNGSSIVQLAGKGIPETNTKKLTVDGPSALNDTVTVAEGKTITFTNEDLSGGMVRHITGKNALNDGWYIGSGGESNKGFLEIGTIDDGNEEIRFVTRGSADTVRRTLKLIDDGGDTRVPGNIYIDAAMGGGGSAFISKNKAYFGAGGADIYMRNTAGGANNQLTITDSGSLLFQAKPVYWEGRKPTLNELGLGTAAVRDVGVTTGNVMEVGAFGIGGNDGTSINDITSVKDMMTRLKDTGGTIWRGAVKSGSNVPNSPYAHGSGFFMNAGDTMAAINIDYGSARVRVYAANNAALNADQVKVNELYGTANKPTAADVNAVSKTGDTMSGNLVVNGNITSAFVDTRIVKASGVVGANPDNQGAWISWNRNSGSGATNFMNHRGGGPGGFEWFNGTTGNWTWLATLNNTGEFKTISNIYAGNVKIDTTGNITGGTLFGGNLNNYLLGMKTDISNSDGNANTRVLKSGDTMTGNLLINANLKVENSQGTMVDFGSETSGNYSRVTLSRKISDDSAKVAMLKITPAGQVQFGIQDTVSAESPTKSMMISNNGFSFDGDTTITESLNVSKTVNATGNLQAHGITARNNLQVNGQGYFANSIEVQQNISTKLDNSMIILGKDADLGLVKKNGSSSRLAFANGRSFVVAKSSANRITDPGTETYTDVFSVTGAGDVNVYRNISIGGTGWISASPTASNHLTNKKYVDDTASSTLSSSNSYTDSEITKLSTDSSSKYLPLVGGVLTGALTVSYGSSGQIKFGPAGAGIRAGGTDGDILVIGAGDTGTGGIQIRPKGFQDSTVTVGISVSGRVTAPLFSVSAEQGMSAEDLTRKDYVDVLVSNSVGTRVALAGADMTGKLTAPNIESTDQLKSKSLWVTGTTALNGIVNTGSSITSAGPITTNGGSFNLVNSGNSHLFFRKANGDEKGLVYADDSGNVVIRANGTKSWGFFGTGLTNLPDQLFNKNGITTTTDYPSSGTYKNTASLKSQFSGGQFASLYFQEVVGQYHQAIINVYGFGQDNSFFFRAGGDFICTRNGSFDNVEIRSDRRAKSDIKIIDNALEKVESLTGNTYDLHNTSGGITRSAGLIAQEVQEVLPEAVTQDIEQDGGLLRLNYNSVIALLVESVKELSAEVKMLKSKLK